MVSTQSVSGKTARKPQGPLERLNARAAGIDIGAHEHYVAIPADLDEQPVRTFGCFTPDLHEMARWLKERGIETVAMESTGVYWIPVYRFWRSMGWTCGLCMRAMCAVFRGARRMYWTASGFRSFTASGSCRVALLFRGSWTRFGRCGVTGRVLSPRRASRSS